MNEPSLPENYKGYSTADLVRLWDSIPERTLESPRVPREMVLTMRDLLTEYKLAPLDWSWDKEQRKADIAQSKRLLAPFGKDPAPWTDAEGNRLPQEGGPTASL